MRGLSRPVRIRLFAIPTRDTTSALPGFEATEPRVHRRLEEIGTVSVLGYNAVLGQRDSRTLVNDLKTVIQKQGGWAYEGTATALALLDNLTPWNWR